MVSHVGSIRKKNTVSPFVSFSFFLLFVSFTILRIHRPKEKDPFLCVSNGVVCCLVGINQLICNHCFF